MGADRWFGSGLGDDGGRASSTLVDEKGGGRTGGRGWLAGVVGVCGGRGIDTTGGGRGGGRDAGSRHVVTAG